MVEYILLTYGTTDIQYCEKTIYPYPFLFYFIYFFAYLSHLIVSDHQTNLNIKPEPE